MSEGRCHAITGPMPIFSYLIPLAFVVLWSTGFIGAKWGLPYIEPLHFLALRFAIVVAILALVAALFRLPWPERAQWLHLGVTGVLLHSLYLGAAFVGIAWGIEAGASSLMAALQPLVMALFVILVLGETLGKLQWLGIALGIIGVALVLNNRLNLGFGTMAGVWASLVMPLASAAALIYQKRFVPQFPLFTGSLIQFAAALVLTGIAALIFEQGTIQWNGQLAFALGWLVLVLSIGAITLLHLLVRANAAAQVGSLFFLVPVSTAIIAWPLFGEQLGLVAIVGFVVTIAGVLMVHRGQAK